MNRPKTELEKKHKEFEDQIAQSESFWNTYSLVVLGEDYASAIAKTLKRDKSLISRQLKTLNQLGLVEQLGTGVKQFYRPNWSVMTHYWIWSTENSADIIPAIDDVLFEPNRVPNWLGSFYLEPQESKIWKEKNTHLVRNLLEPIVPHLSPLVAKIIEQISDRKEIFTFWDAFFEISVAFGVGLPDSKYIDLKKVATASDRALLDVLYNSNIRAWLKLQVLGRLQTSNIVRNHVLKIADLLPS